MVTLLVVAPWYCVSFRISAGGFNYAPGQAYAWLSLTTDCAAIISTLSWPGVAAVLLGTIEGWRNPVTRPITRLAIAMVLATLILQALIPVALEDRYVLPAIPWAVVLGVTGVAASVPTKRATAAIIGLLLLASLAPATIALVRRPPKPDIGAPAAAERMRAMPGIWLVDGRAGGEGAVIAEAAYVDRGRRAIWAARASQWLSSSDFMGRGYTLSIHSPAEARAVLDRLGVRGVVSIAEKSQLAYPHSALLRAAAAPPVFAVRVQPFRRGAGSSLVATRSGPVSAHPDLLTAGSASADAAAMSKTF